ncbi:Serine/threonine-protein kinase [Apophysomyces sp. BC1021]|nr:Serine/threonine-protein kinase [Apophysomyces sp. BC1021]
MEYCSLGDLAHYMKRKRIGSKIPSAGLREKVVRDFLKQLASALKFLRSQNLVHRDIKPQNLLLVPPKDNATDAIPILKVADFGFARVLPSASLADTLCGSPLYMGPEVLSCQKYDAKADLWSVGTVLYEMITGQPPFQAQNLLELLQRIEESNDRISFPLDNPMISSTLKDLIRKLLKKDPSERISFKAFFMHPAVVQEMEESSTSKNASHVFPPFVQSPENLMRVRPAKEKSARTQSFGVSPLHSSVRPSKTRHRLGSEKRDTLLKYDPHTHDNVEEEVMKEYVVLDRRTIEANQFADEMDEPRQLVHRKLALNMRRGSEPPISLAPAIASPRSRERKVSVGSAGSAFAKAISMASVRLFGTEIQSPNTNTPQHSIADLTIGETDPEEEMVLKQIERMACMARTVASFADAKLDAITSGRATNETALAEEAMVLHVKALSLLESGMDIARRYWSRMSDTHIKVTSARLNSAVQWMRGRFNECLERASFEGSKCKKNGVGTSVERLLYDRALEISRAAAVHELVGENMPICEEDYQRAIWMLEAILETAVDATTTTTINGGEVIEEDDRLIIRRFIDSIQHRILVLRKKLVGKPPMN